MWFTHERWPNTYDQHPTTEHSTFGNKALEKMYGNQPNSSGPHGRYKSSRVKTLETFNFRKWSLFFFFPEMKKPKSKLKNGVHDISQGSCTADGDGESKSQLFDLPAKILAIHKVRWNMNKGSERWLCHGGAAGIVRCQEIS